MIPLCIFYNLFVFLIRAHTRAARAHTRAELGLAYLSTLAWGRCVPQLGLVDKEGAKETRGRPGGDPGRANAMPATPGVPEETRDAPFNYSCNICFYLILVFIL